jgi:hypothetical protein
LPANTTFSVELAVGATATAGGGLGGPLDWSFTTGTPQGAISNQVTFLSDRAGVTNVWSMNPDGTGQRQLTAELTPVLDYAVAPDGSSLVTGDGRQLVYQRADGSDRRVLTQATAIEFDPAYAPNGDRIAFGRADAETGAGLGLWEWTIGGGEASRIEMPPELGEPASPEPQPSGARDALLRAPRYAPDGQALAYVDAAGWIGIVELPAERHTRVPYEATSPPAWLPDSSAVLVGGERAEGGPTAVQAEAPVMPLAAAVGDGAHRLARSGTAVTDFLGGRAVVLAVGGDGAVAYLDDGGRLRLLETGERPRDREVPIRDRVVAAAFAPGEPSLVIVVAAEDEVGSVELLDPATGRRTVLAPAGARPRWLP